MHARLIVVHTYLVFEEDGFTGSTPAAPVHMKAVGGPSRFSVKPLKAAVLDPTTCGLAWHFDAGPPNTFRVAAIPRGGGGAGGGQYAP